MLPIFLIIILAEETVELKEMLSVDIFFILNKLLFPLLFVSSPIVAVRSVRSVSAKLISLPAAAAFANGADGVGKS